MRKILTAIIAAPIIGSIALTPLAFARDAAKAAEEISRDVARGLAKVTLD